MSRKFLFQSLPPLLSRSTLASSHLFCTFMGKKDPLFSDVEDDLNLGAPECPSTPSWFIASPDASRHETVVSNGWDEGKIGGRKREKEMEIAKLFISDEIVSRLAGRGITKLFPIQRAVLDPALQGRDMICRARTGTGKTLAYGIPIMDKILRFKTIPQAKRRQGRNPLALIMTPTRELAQQVEKEFRDSSPLRIVSVCGGKPFPQQLNELNYGVDVLVGTPGRINDLLFKNVLNLSNVQYVVLDESDVMLAVSFAQIVEKILRRLPRRHQSIMFSSTMPSWMTEFQDIYLNDPLIIDLVGDSTQKLPEGLMFYSIASNNYQKHLVVGPLIKEHAGEGKCIVFTHSKNDVDRLSKFLGRNLKCEAFHADMHQSHREKILAGFREGNFNILVATDVAARGLHIPDVDLVIHFEVPSIPENFLHRSGRTGRAGRKGKVVLIYSEDQRDDARNIEQEIGCKFIELPRMAFEDGGELTLASSDGGKLLCKHGDPGFAGVQSSSGLLSDRLDRMINSRFRHSECDQGKGQHSSHTKISSKISSGLRIPSSGSSENNLREFSNNLFSKIASMPSVNTSGYRQTTEGLSCDAPQKCISGRSGHSDWEMSYFSNEDCSLGRTSGFHHSRSQPTKFSAKPIASFGGFTLDDQSRVDDVTSISEESSD